MKVLLILLFSSLTWANCLEKEETSLEDVTYNVNTNTPKYLIGATITVTLANGETSTVSTDKFMVVPRKQTTVVGQNQKVLKKVTCSNESKEKNNILMGGLRKDVTELETETNGNTAKVYSKKEVIPEVLYYRRNLIGTKLGDLGAGAGLDSNGTAKGFIGVSF